MVRRTSDDALNQLPATIDFIFVDGDHSWKGIETDWSIVEQLLKPGGIACFHDTSPPPDNLNELRDSARFFDQVIKPNPKITTIWKPVSR